MSANQFRLLNERRFLPFFLAQSFGAFNDNVLKSGIVIIVAFNATAFPGMAPALLTQIAGGLFILPYVLFSGLAGELSERYEKTLVIRAVKVAEIGIMGIASVGFYCGSLKLLLLALFLMGVHSTFFAPAKYGMLPVVLAHHELVGGNALVEMGTFVAILLGQLLAGILAGFHHMGVMVTALLGLSIAGLLVSCAIPRTNTANQQHRIDWNPFTSTLANLKCAAADKGVFLSILGISWFWFYGILVLAQVPIYGKDVLGGSESVVTGMLIAFSVGVGAGSLLCESLGNHQIEIGLVPLGAIGLTLFGVDLYGATPEHVLGINLAIADLLTHVSAWRIYIDLALIGASGGLFIVPLYAHMQSRAKPGEMSRIIAGSSIINAVFMVIASGFGAIAIKSGLSVPRLLLVTALLNALVTGGLFWVAPEFTQRFQSLLRARRTV